MTDREAVIDQETVGRFWPDWLAESIISRRAGKHTVATGITPSGPIHLGNIREVLTGDAVYRALRDAGADARLIYIADTFDPLRHVYPFLPSEYEKFVGKPLYAIPDPEGCCSDYAEHFLQPFLKALNELGVTPEVYRAHEMYQQGMYTDAVEVALRNAERIAGIVKDISGRDLPAGWVPYNPECRSCGRIADVGVTGLRVDEGLVDYSCSCGHKGAANFRNGEGKLPWRVDWPARWKILGVTVEPFGKDHAAAGGSFDTGAAIVREVFGGEPPEPVIYEWIYLKGVGAMASSTGVAISISNILAMAPPEAVRCFVLRPRPERHIDFDPGNGIPALVDDYHGLEKRYYGLTDEPADEWVRRVVTISQPSGDVPPEPPTRIPFVHLAIALQTGQKDFEKVERVLVRSGYRIREEEKDSLRRDLERVAVWLERYAPDAYRFEVAASLPESVNELSNDQKSYLGAVADVLRVVNWEPVAVHDAIYATARDRDLPAKQAFHAVYVSLLGKKNGPRAGYFISSLERDFVVSRFKEAAARPSV